MHTAFDISSLPDIAAYTPGHVWGLPYSMYGNRTDISPSLRHDIYCRKPSLGLAIITNYFWTFIAAQQILIKCLIHHYCQEKSTNFAAFFLWTLSDIQLVVFPVTVLFFLLNSSNTLNFQQHIRHCSFMNINRHSASQSRKLFSDIILVSELVMDIFDVQSFTATSCFRWLL